MTAQGPWDQRTQDEITGNMLLASIPNALEKGGKKQTSLYILGWIHLPLNP